MVLAHYQTLYESSVAFGMRKALQSNRDKDQMGRKRRTLEVECDNLDKEIELLDKQYDEIVIRDEETDRNDEESHV